MEGRDRAREGEREREIEREGGDGRVCKWTREFPWK